jgi:hypothetical protein
LLTAILIAPTGKQSRCKTFFLMILTNLLGRGYFPKELPPCFISTEFANKFNQINNDLVANESRALNAILAAIQRDTKLTTEGKSEEKVKAKQIFRNRLKYSDSVYFTIPKAGLARNTIKIPNPLHQGKLSEYITSNYSAISLLYNDSTLSTTKPEIETEMGEGKRAVKHNNYGFFKEQSIIGSFNYRIQLKTDISKFYSSIYTHSFPWVTFGGKEKYKRNRDLHPSDQTKVGIIYGDFIDDALTWCQNQQTMGIPIGPDTSLIVAEIIACHIDKLLEQRLKKRKIDWKALRYYDDYFMFFHSELDAQVALNELRDVLGAFELKINDEKTVIGISSNELERDWALTLKSFFFRPSESDQKEDIWNFFSLAFRFAREYPKESVLKFALNKFSFVRIEKENWDFFESLLFRLGLAEPSSLAKISKILISYKNLISKSKLKIFCFELINRNFQNANDYELSWALWLLKEFKIKPTRDLYTSVFKSKSVCASLIALDLINQYGATKGFDFTNLEELFSVENLNKQYWLLIYECTYKRWLSSVSRNIVSSHFYFHTLVNNGVYFYDENKSLEPLTVEKSYFDRIARKIGQVDKYIQNNNFKNKKVNSEIKSLAKMLLLKREDKSITKEDLQNRLEASDLLIKKIISELDTIRQEQTKFEKKRVYFVLGKRLEELKELTLKESNLQTKQESDLLFDPDYE